MKFKSIAMRIFIFVIPTIIITTLSFVVLSYYVSNSQINKTINEKMYESLHAADLEIQLELYKNAAVAIDFSYYAKLLKADSFDHEANKNFLSEGVLSNKNTFAGGIWYEPYAFDPASYYFGPFLYQDDKDGIVYIPEYGEYVDYFNEDWYVKGKGSKGELIWSKVYYDPVSAKTMVTATKPFYNKNGNFAGVGTADMNLENIQKIVNNILVGKTGKAFILGSGGEYISFYNEGKNVNDTIQNDADSALAQLGNELINNTSGNTKLSRNGKEYRVYYRTMANVNWTLAITFEESEISSSTLNSFLIMTIIPVLGLVLVIFGIFMVINYLRRIVNKVNSFADLAASGDFLKRIEVTEIDEFGFMERRLNKMISNMNDMSQHSAQLLKIAEEASNSKSEFLSRMSHEIRTPMNAIIGMTQIAKTSNDADRISDCLTKVEGASKHLLALINDILDMSKIEANKLELTKEEFNLEKVLINNYNMMLVKAEEKNQRLVLNVDKDIPYYVIGDEMRLSQVITNLVGNAIKFTPQNGSITVEACEIKRDNEYSVIKISIRDDGIGLSKEQQSKLFRSFEQADGSTSRRFGGTGLGLAISKRIVELMDGNIWTESELDKGSVFAFTIKVLRGSGFISNQQAGKEDMSSITHDFSGNTIMLAEDIGINREIIEAILEHTGVTIEVAENGIQAVEMFRAAPDKYDLILMDIQMPEMDGLEATKQIRSMDIKRAKTIPIIAMTANVLNEDVIRCKEAGMNDHIAKPLEPEIIMVKLNNYFFMKDCLSHDIW